MSDTTTDNKDRAVLVENLSPSITSKTLNDFFFLCGPIQSITLSEPKDGEESLTAVVVFEESSAAGTAVLLTNAVLVGRTITVRYFNPETDAQFAKGQSGSSTSAAAAAAASPAEGAEGAAAPAAAPGEHPSVAASLLAASYKLGDDIRTRAAEVDTKYGVTQGFQNAVDRVDQSLGLTEKWTTFTTAVNAKSEELHVPEKMNAVGAGLQQAGEALGHAASTVVDSAMQNQYVSNAWTAISGWGTSIASGWNQLTQEAQAIYAQQTGTAAPASAAPAAETPSTDTDTITVPVSEQSPEAAAAAAAAAPDAAPAPAPETTAAEDKQN